MILAAGRGSRMRHLTAAVPKPMLKVRGKNLIEHKLEALPDAVDEVVLVTGYKGDVIRSYFGDRFGRFRITYVEQRRLDGTAGALWQAKGHLADGGFLVLMGDDIYDRRDLESLARSRRAVLVKKVSGTASGGLVTLAPDGTVSDISEGTHVGDDLLMNAAAYSLGPELFECEPVKIEGREEFGLPQTIAAAAHRFPMSVVETSAWIQLSAPEDIEVANSLLEA